MIKCEKEKACSLGERSFPYKYQFRWKGKIKVIAVEHILAKPLDIEENN